MRKHSPYLFQVFRDAIELLRLPRWLIVPTFGSCLLLLLTFRPTVFHIIGRTMAV
jgi:hypothetical protein